MSRSYSARYRLAAARRQEIHDERIRQVTSRYYQRYCDMYQAMCREGCTEYIPDEMDRLRYDLERIQENLRRAPETAQAISREVAGYIYTFRAMARTARQTFERQERIRREQLAAEKRREKTALHQLYVNALQDMDPVLAHFAHRDMQTLRQTMESDTLTIPRLQEKLMAIRKSAETKANEWKAETERANRKTVATEQLKDVEQELQKEKAGTEDQRMAILEQLRHIQDQAVEVEMEPDALQDQIVNLQEKADEIAISEDTRREYATSLYYLLQKLGFQVQPPTLEDGLVRLVAQRASGNRVAIQIPLQGDVEHQFDSYEGKTCLKDINILKENLVNQYSIYLSDECIHSENPDRLTMEYIPALTPFASFHGS